MIQPRLDEPKPDILEEIYASSYPIVYLRFKNDWGDVIFIRRGTSPPAGFKRYVPEVPAYPFCEDLGGDETDFVERIWVQVRIATGADEPE